MTQIGKIIKGLATMQGMTTADLANELGISRQALNKRLNGDIRISSLKQCLETLGYELYYGKDGQVNKL